MPKKKKEIKIPPLFSHTVCKAIGHYVYRLVDSRNGETFYVGKGQSNNRVFKHIIDAKNGKKGNTSKRIKDIYDDNHEVIHIIHKHNLPSKEIAEMVEAALIDAYDDIYKDGVASDLTNQQRGHGSPKYGSTTAKSIIKKYGLKEFKLKDDVLLININKSYDNPDEPRKTNKEKESRDNENISENTIYDMVRYRWRVNPNRAERAKYVIAVVRGVTEAIFTADKWYKADDERFKELSEKLRTREDDNKRYGFVGKCVGGKIKNHYIGKLGKRVPKNLKHGPQNPIRYSYK